MLAAPPEQRPFHLAWSYWRRAHQAVARRCHRTRRARQPALLDERPSSTQAPAPWPELTDEQWARVQPLLRAAQAARGRPPREHRTILEGLIWLMRTGTAWRQLPDGFGPWPTVYSRYRHWCATGLWPRLLQALELRLSPGSCAQVGTGTGLPPSSANS